MNPNMHFVRYIIIFGLLAAFSIPFICFWLDSRDERKERNKHNNTL